MKKILSVFLACLMLVSLVLSLVSCSGISEDKFKDVLREYGYVVTLGDDGALKATKDATSITFRQYEDEIEVVDHMILNEQMIDSMAETSGFEKVSYGENCEGVEGSAAVILVASSDYTIATFMTTQSNKLEVLDIIEELGY